MLETVKQSDKLDNTLMNLQTTAIVANNVLIPQSQLSDRTIRQLLFESQLDRLDTRLLLGHVLGFTRIELILKDEYQLTKKQYQSYIKIYDECLSGKPIAYILGHKEFYSHSFKVNQATLIPRPETELLVDAVLELANHGNKVLDLGTGSGCIAISLKLVNQTLDITAADKYPQTLEAAIDNALNLKAQVKFIQSDWFSNINDKYDIIVSNPPYIKADDEHLHSLTFEPQFALTDFADGMGAIRHIIQHSGRYLKGYLLLEHGYNQGMATQNLMLDSGFVDVRTIKDYAKIDRVTLGRMK